MPTLSAGQIAGYAKGAGFTGNDVSIAVAVALAESGGQTDIRSKPNSNGTYDHGLWQINSVHAKLLASGTWSDPADNARMAYTVWRGSGWRAWTTYNTGAYLVHLAAARAAAAAPTTPTGAGSAPATATSDKAFPEGKSFKLPLSAKDRESIYAAIIFMVQAKGIKTSGIAEMKKYPDAALVTYYDVIRLLYNAKVQSVGESVANNSLVQTLKFLTDPHNWIRVAMFVGGAILILMAAYKVAGASIPLSVGGAVKAIHKSAYGGLK